MHICTKIEHRDGDTRGDLVQVQVAGEHDGFKGGTDEDGVGTSYPATQLLWWDSAISNSRP